MERATKRTCSRCKKEKLISDFYKSSYPAYKYWCKECLKEYIRKWKKKNLERVKVYSKTHNIKHKKQISDYNKVYEATHKTDRVRRRKTYYQKHKERIKMNGKKWNIKSRPLVRAEKLKYTYGITIDDYNNMLKSQKECCAICGTHKDDLKTILGVDHNHQTNKVRGLLCSKCNIALGGFHDDPILLMKAIKYLKKYENISECVVS